VGDLAGQDEYPEINRAKLLQLLGQLERVVRFFFTSRPNVEPHANLVDAARIQIYATESGTSSYKKHQIHTSHRISVITAKDAGLKFERRQHSICEQTSSWNKVPSSHAQHLAIASQKHYS
jgi:hypothetical protein